MSFFQTLIDAGYEIRENESLSPYTTLKIGGPALGLIEVYRTEDLNEVTKIAQENNIKFLVIALGSDLLVSDEGYDGLVIVNKTRGIDLISDVEVEAFSGAVLQDLVDFANNNSLGGFENMAGIPGSVGGAIYGNAGAYGQSISDNILSVKYFDGKSVQEFSKDECRFTYRESIFKDNKNWVILSSKFALKKGSSEDLVAKSKETIELRSKKYPPGIKCPGSFFKNIVASDLKDDVLVNIPEDKIVYGKIPAGYLLEEVGAKGDKLGGIEIASYHGNLFMNNGEGTASDFFELARKYKQKVKEKFNIELESEVQLIGFNQNL